MIATAPIWQEIAATAKVRPSHVFHCFHAMREPGFDAPAFAEFAQLELQHILRIVAAITDRDDLKPVERAKAKRGSRLPDPFVIPPEWLAWAREKRFWSEEDAKSEAEVFIAHWQANGQTMVDWYKCWMKWVGNSRRPNGLRSPQSIETNLGDLNAHYEKTAALYDRLGRWQEARDLRAKIGIAEKVS